MSSTPVILVPGLMCDAAVWTDAVHGLADIATARVVDHGALDSLGAMAAAVLADAPPRFALAGHSMGGRVALEVVRQAPERVQRLALLDTGYQALAEGEAGAKEVAGRQALLALAQQQGMRAMGRAWVQGMVHPDRLADAALVDTILDMFERKTPALFAAQIQALIRRPDAESVLRELQCKTLVLCGQQDSWSPPERHAQMVALVRGGAELVVVPQAGHMVTMEQPQAVVAALRAWLA